MTLSRLDAKRFLGELGVLKSKRPPRRYARLRKAMRRYDLDATEEPRETMVFLTLKDHELKWLEKLARRHGTSLHVEIHRAIETHVQSAGQPQVQLLNTFLHRLNSSIDWHNQLLTDAISKAMKFRARRPRQSRSTAGKHRTAR